MKAHKFDVEDAQKYGIEKALLLQHLKFHQANNEGIPQYTIEGKTWCHARRKTLENMYPYLNGRSISRWLQQLEDDGVIASCKPQSSGSDQTKYYHVVDYKMAFKANEPNGQNDQWTGSKKRQNRQKSVSVSNEPNGQNDHSNGQRVHSARDNNDGSNGQPVHSSIYHYSEDIKLEDAHAREEGPTPENQPAQLEAQFTEGNVAAPARMFGVPVPEQLLMVDGFAAAYREWWAFNKTTHQRHPNIHTVERQFQKLLGLLDDGHHPVQVIDQSIEHMSKSLYAIREDFSSEDDIPEWKIPFDPTGRPNASAYKII